LANRALAHIELCRYRAALDDCDASLRIDAAYAKAHYRRGLALCGLEQRADALDAFGRALGLAAPTDKTQSLANVAMATVQQQLRPPFAIVCAQMREGLGPKKATNIEYVSTHAMFSVFSRAEDSRVMHMCGVPLALLRAREGLQALPRSGEFDNQPATYFMMDPTSGYAPDDWQWNVGEVTLFRRDGVPFTSTHFWVLWDFFNCITDDYGDLRPSEVAAKYFSPRGFRRWLDARYSPENGGRGQAQLPW
jgi:tetratricopeptide (TPR) repeat protein